MIKKYLNFRLNEESGIKNINQIISNHKEFSNDFEIWFHQDLDGVCSALAMKKYIEDYGLKLIDSHIIQYGGLEFAIKNKRSGSMCCLVDFAHGKGMFQIHSDHHDKQTGVETKNTSFKPARSNVETISGEISPGDVFTSTDIKLIQTVDSADFLKNNITPEDIQNCLFSYKKELTPSRNRFLMGLVVNRLLLVFKSKRITVTSLDGKRNHINKNLLECLVLDSSPSLYSIFNNLKHYMNTAVSLEWSMSTRSHATPKKLATEEEITNNLMEYIETRKEFSGKIKHKDIDFIKDYNIVKQYGIGSVFKSGSYDRYIVFKNFPEADFVCTIFPMGLIQVSCNPFKEKKLKEINLGAIAREVLGKFKYQLSNINIPLTEIKRISEDEIEKMKNKYGEDYEAVGFQFSDLLAFYKDLIIVLPNRKSGDLKTRSKLNLDNEIDPDVKLLKEWMNKPFSVWTNKIKEEIGWLKIPIWNIIEETSGGHPSITNIQSLNYLGSRKDLLKILFKTENYTDVMKLIADEFIKVLKEKIDAVRKGKKIEYQTSGVNLKSNAIAENFEYFINDKNNTKKVTKDEFINFGMNVNFEPKKNSEKSFKMDIKDNKITGYYEPTKDN